MWVLAMFDLPVTDKVARKRYARFRKVLLREGFLRVQFSIYAKFCRSEEASVGYRRRVAEAVPEKGEVRIMAVTDHQYSKMTVLHGKRRARVERPTPQLMLF